MKALFPHENKFMYSTENGGGFFILRQGTPHIKPNLSIPEEKL